MSTFVRNLSIVLATFSAIAGFFIGTLLSLLEVQLSSTSELRWSFIVGMPILLFVSFAWLNQQPAKTISIAALQSIAQLVIFLAPFLWAIRHAQ
jgi:hypothetical protein